MTNLRVTQDAAETLSNVSPDLRVTQIVLEMLSGSSTTVAPGRGFGPPLAIFANIPNRSDAIAMTDFIAAHIIKHHAINEELARQYRSPVSVAPLDGPLNADWFGRHEILHRAIEDIIGIETTSVIGGEPWSNDADFADWMLVHRDKHDLIEQTLGLY